MAIGRPTKIYVEITIPRLEILHQCRILTAITIAAKSWMFLVEGLTVCIKHGPIKKKE